MAVLTANRERYIRNVGSTSKGYGVGAASKEFYEGQLVCYSTTGTITPATDTSGFRIAGVCTKRVTTAASGTTYIEFEFGHQEWFPGTGATAADMQSNVCVSDDNNYIDATATNDVEIGTLVQLETKAGVAGGWIRIAEFGLDAA